MVDLVEDEVVPIEGLQFIGLGKIIYSDFGADFGIPPLHFLTIVYGEGHFQAVNLEFQLFSGGETCERAIANLVKLITSCIISACERREGFELLRNLALLNDMNAYWKKYREIEFNLAKTKNHLGQRIENTIKTMIDEAFIELIEEMAKEFGDDFKKIMSRWFSGMFQNVPNILYQSYSEVAYGKALITN